MPCWYYEKKDLRNTPSFRDGISAEVEARYRREGARLIIDCGTKLGLRYDTVATGVVYFHRFYMFHSFKQFHRYVTATACLFLAGKVEETPKKCRDLYKVIRTMLTDSQFAVFGNDPREELMTMERILLQTIKFDLMVEHPYAYLLRFAKLIKGDAKKIENLVQMSWTFVNDSLCTNLCLQWESDIIAVALMYLGSRLTKVELNDWEGKVAGSKAKWYDSLVPDVTIDIIEDVCHHVLDLYSKRNEKKREDSPPPPPPPKAAASSAGATPSKRSRSPSPTKSKKSSRHASPSARPSPATLATGSPPIAPGSSQQPVPGQQQQQQQPNKSAGGGAAVSARGGNPYMSSQMYSSSFMSGEGSNAIQTLIGGAPRGAQPAAPAGASSGYSAGKASAAPPSLPSYAQPPPGHPQYSGSTSQPQYPPPAAAPPGAPSAPYSTQPYTVNTAGGSYDSQYSNTQYTQQQQQQYSQYQQPSQQQYPTSQYPAPPPTTQYGGSTKPAYPPAAASSAGDSGGYTAPPPQPGAYGAAYGDRTYAQAASSGSGSAAGAGYSHSYGQPPPPVNQSYANAPPPSGYGHTGGAGQHGGGGGYSQYGGAGPGHPRGHSGQHHQAGSRGAGQRQPRR